MIAKRGFNSRARAQRYNIVLVLYRIEREYIRWATYAGLEPW